MAVKKRREREVRSWTRYDYTCDICGVEIGMAGCAPGYWCVECGKMLCEEHASEGTFTAAARIPNMLEHFSSSFVHRASICPECEHPAELLACEEPLRVLVEAVRNMNTASSAFCASHDAWLDYARSKMNRLKWAKDLG